MFLKVSWSVVVFVPGGQFPEVDSKQQGQHARTLTMMWVCNFISQTRNSAMNGVHTPQPPISTCLLFGLVLSFPLTQF